MNKTDQECADLFKAVMLSIQQNTDDMDQAQEAGFITAIAEACIERLKDTVPIHVFAKLIGEVMGAERVEVLPTLHKPSDKVH